MRLMGQRLGDARGEREMIVRSNSYVEPITTEPLDVDPLETSEWLESLEAVLRTEGPERAQFLIEMLIARADRAGVRMPSGINTPYLNTILLEDQPPYPGNRELERRIKSIIRWNAMAMVVRANQDTNVGGHISTFASAATL